MNRLPPLDPAVATTRVAVRRALRDVGMHDGLVLVALSGGADSLALAAATAFEARGATWQAGAVIVDHGLQAGSDAVADTAAATAKQLGLDPVLVRRVTVESGAEGPEADARRARYRSLGEALEETGASWVLTGHTHDDQAEQVLLALARGSGGRSLAGIPARRGRVVRPFLEVTREMTERACAAQGLHPWKDPHNLDPDFARVRVRERVMPTFERELGPGIAAALTRTAMLAREDADALDGIAVGAIEGITEAVEHGVTVDIAALAAQPNAIRNRMIRLIASERFGAQLSREHALAIAALVTAWRGQGPSYVPGIVVRREADRLVFVSNEAVTGRGGAQPPDVDPQFTI